jgi:hypothetical protein
VGGLLITGNLAVAQNWTATTTPSYHWRAVASSADGKKLAAAAGDSVDTAPAKTSQAIPWSQVGDKAGANYQGDGLAVIFRAKGARLRCVFQRLEGEATREGLWLTSTITNAIKDRFRVTAAVVERVERGASQPPSAAPSPHALRALAPRLPDNGTVAIDGQTVRWRRPGLTEEYSVSLDGVRQDFIVAKRPAGVGPLCVELAVSGAQVEPLANGARLVLAGSGRKLAYSRLRATDDTGKELLARLVVGGAWPSGLARSKPRRPDRSGEVFNMAKPIGRPNRCSTRTSNTTPETRVLP